MGVIFGDDDAKVRKDKGPRKIALIRKIVSNMLRQDTTWPKVRLRGRRKMTGRDDDERMRVLGFNPI